MTITEQKAFLRSYTGQAQAPADFAQRWQETAAALHPAVSCAPVAFGNPCGVYERLTVTFDGRSVTARVIHPAADGVHPLLLMYHDLNRGVRGWHHITRFLALGFGVVAPEAEPFRADWKVQPAQAAFRQRYLSTRWPWQRPRWRCRGWTQAACTRLARASAADWRCWQRRSALQCPAAQR